MKCNCRTNSPGAHARTCPQFTERERSTPALGSAISRALVMIDQKEKLIAEIQNAIRENLLARRKRAGITQKQLAKMLGFRSVAYVSELEGGTRRWTENAAKMADTYLPNTEVSDRSGSGQ